MKNIATKSVHDLVSGLLSSAGVSPEFIDPLTVLILFAIIALVSYLAFIAGRYILITILTRLTKKTTNRWDDALVNHHFFRRLANIIPAAILMAFIPDIFRDYEGWIQFLTGLINIYIIFTILLALDSLLNAVTDIYQDFEIAKTKPIKGYIQIIKIGIYFIGGILIVSEVIGKSPVYLLTGLGAITAVLLFVFKDPILGFIGSLQLSANDMVRPNDWIVMEKYGADGIVTDMNLTAVKVRNWDMTITTIPTYQMVADSFTNWRGMHESGGRRIMRSVKINMNSIKFCTPEMIEKFKRIRLLKDYIPEKEDELKAHNERYDIDSDIVVNTRRQTNIGVFRQYLLNYLKNHEKVKQDMIIQVRQLEPTEYGLPVQIYCFSTKQAWVEYEKVQSDIFDHILTVVPEFGLKVFQNPTGEDFRALGAFSEQKKTNDN
ncbi:MAG: mechanosensitive ion channel family protein [Bacteroidales bacterium]|nr:mechanosensitive ion channel family protein [Bacteroidales bacterium]MCF8336756.1 mechanosensitive ion channel family protein [Bacteroidales bacterium]